MALTQTRLTQFYGDVVPVYLQVGVDGGSKIYDGALVCMNASGYLTKGAVATTLIAVGVSQQLADNTNGSDGDISCKVRTGVAKFKNSAGGDEITVAEIGKGCWIVDDETVAKTDNGNTRSPAGLVVAIDSDGVRVHIAPQISRELIDAEAGTLVAGALLAVDAAATTGATGGNLIGFDDSGSKTSAATVADALDEIYVHLASAQTEIEVPLSNLGFDADGDPIVKFADGDFTTPGWNLANSEAFGIRWNNKATHAPVLGSVGIPNHIKDTSAGVLHILASKIGATVGDAVTFTVGVFGNVLGALHDAGADLGGTTGAMTGDATSKTVQEVTLSVDIPAAPANLTITIQPTNGTLGTDDVIIHRVWFECTGKLLTS